MATRDDLDGARVVMLDAVHRDFGTGYVPRRHRDIMDPEAFYLRSARHTPSAPWAVPAPATVLALLGALAVTAAGGVGLPRPPRWTQVRGFSATPRQPERGTTPMRHTAAVTAREDPA
ncbi:hypothetical protein [Saccharothrix sp. ALI-22-I]|uniref:hypothetical protein n=1 Tax=Saccharothrix sp. ALI-22-I TaxID=1933778 RepID=UPI001930EC7D|nr:hypothetical protein [Saccharothrix sp. ALI-22-I]